jgi:glycosyltransferase involved in cell wall biosynthesis
MIFLSESESQGLAYQECLAANVPVLAWDVGKFLNPTGTAEQPQYVPATSVPYFDERCGLRFAGPSDFADQLDRFLDRLRGCGFAPRDYVLEHLTLEKCARHFIDIFQQVGA